MQVHQEGVLPYCRYAVEHKQITFTKTGEKALTETHAEAKMSRLLGANLQLLLS